MQSLGIGTDLGNVQIESRSTEYDDSIILSSEKLAYYDRCVEGGMRTNMPSPYYMNIKGLRKGRLTYAYNEHEMKEIAKCVTDIHYFANNYCALMTDMGIQNISLYPFQYRVLSELVNHRDNILLASRQSSKCLTYNNLIELNDNSKISIGDLYIENKEKISILQKIKKVLYKILYILEN